MEDILEAEEVEIHIKSDGKVIWVNVVEPTLKTPEVCRLRVGNIKSLTILDDRETKKKKGN